MSKLVKKIIGFIILITLCSKICYSQTDTSSYHFSILGGAAIPQGEFSSSSNNSTGFANIGYCGKVSYSKTMIKLNKDNLNWISSITVSINNYDDNSVLKFNSPYFEVTTGNYINTWAMTGLGFETNASEKIKIYGMGLVGLLISDHPDITVTSGDWGLQFTTNTATAFGYSFGLGLVLDKMILGVNYYSSKPEFESSYFYNGHYTKDIARNQIDFLAILIGYRF